MSFFKNLGDGIIKFCSASKQLLGFKLADDVRDVAGELRCSQDADGLEGDKLKRELARRQQERDETIIRLLEQIEKQTR